jgi:two-component system phosphate regulon sensor histidine kinase PhoR
LDNKFRINILSLSAGLIVFGLVFYEFVQLFMLYEKNKAQVEKLCTRALDRVTFRIDNKDYDRHINLSQEDISDLYRKILESEFEGVFSENDSINIKDTTIVVDQTLEPFIVVKPSVIDSLAKDSVKNIVLIQEATELKDFLFGAKGMDKKSKSRLEIHLDLKVIQHILDKDKLVEKLIKQAITDNKNRSPQERVNVRTLATLLKEELDKEELPDDFRFNVLKEGKKRELIRFQEIPSNYSNELNSKKGYSRILFPSDKVNQKLWLTVYFPDERAFILREIQAYILVTFFLIVLMISTLYFLLKTILDQRHISEMKSDFISNMTHEFKTPISTISLACQALKDKDMVSEEIYPAIQPFVSMISDENKRLENLVEGILRSAVLNKGDVILRKEDINIQEIISRQIEIILFKKKENTEIELIVEGTPRLVNADKLHFTNVIGNLLDNAVKYSTQTAHIRIKIEYNKSIFISVKDRGIGIAKEHLTKIFDNLYRVPTGNIHNVKGFGLGLSYVKAICDAHRWSLSVKSEEQRGSEFIIEIKQHGN